MKEQWDQSEIARTEDQRDRLASAAEDMVRTYQETQMLLGELHDDENPVPDSVRITLDGMRERQARNGNIYTYTPSGDSK